MALGFGNVVLPPFNGAEEVDYLVVAGGGGGGVGGGGGAGAGGFRTATGLAVSGSLTVTVGAGGAGGTGNPNGANGANSVFSSITSVGGGGGGGISDTQLGKLASAINDKKVSFDPWTASGPSGIVNTERRMGSNLFA